MYLCRVAADVVVTLLTIRSLELQLVNPRSVEPFSLLMIQQDH